MLTKDGMKYLKEDGYSLDAAHQVCILGYEPANLLGRKN
jgi:hypothetical protein